MSGRLAAAWPWLILAIGLALMTPGLARLWQVEQSNNTYELTTADTEVRAFDQSGLDPDATLDALQAAGLRSIAIEMLTMADLAHDGRAHVMSRGEVTTLMAATGRDPAGLPTGEGAYVAVAPGQDEVLDRITRAVSAATIEPVPEVGEGIYFVTGLASPSSTPLGFDDARIRALTDRGLAVLARVPSAVTDLGFVTDELARMKRDFGIDRVLFSGATTPFAADTESLGALATWLGREGFSVLTIEFFAQPGIDAYVRITDSAIRLHGLGIVDLADVEDSVERAVRGVKERNIRVFFVRPTPTLAADIRLDQMVQSMSGIVERMPAAFELGVAEPFERLERTPLLAVGGILAATGVAAATGALVGPPIAAAMGIGMAALASLSALTASGLLGDLVRLGVASAAAVLAVFVARPRARLGSATVEYLKAFCVVVIGGLVVVGLAYRNDFLVGSADFFGVKALLIGPALVAACAAAYISLGRPGIHGTTDTLGAPIRVWHLAVLGMAVGVIGYLALRSDNTGAASDIELLFRQQLENLLYVRPRTKEFLIGLPVLLMGIMIAWRWRHGWWLYAIAAIGTASAIDTFTHFHAPMLASLIRTAAGFGLGYLVGLVGLGAAWAVSRYAARHGVAWRQ